MFFLFIIFVASSATEQSYFQRIATTPIYLKKNIEKQDHRWASKIHIYLKSAKRLLLSIYNIRGHTSSNVFCYSCVYIRGHFLNCLADEDFPL